MLNVNLDVEYCLEVLEIRIPMLASLLGVTERTMTSWYLNKDLENPKYRRVQALYTVLERMYPCIEQAYMLNVLNDHDEDEMSLLGWIVEKPDHPFMTAEVDDAIARFYAEEEDANGSY